MTNKQNRLLSIIEEAIANFNEYEIHLIKNDLSERCICAKFASYVEKVIWQSEFNEYVVDVEYNRGYNGKDFYPKMLYGRKIVVDLIVHKRAYDNVRGYDNLICIEMKKKYKHFDLTHDKERLRFFTDDNNGFGYEIGFMIVVDRKLEECKLTINEIFCNMHR